MSVLSRYLAEAGQPSMFEHDLGFDELAAPNGTARDSWTPLLNGLEQFADSDLARVQREVARLLEDDGVTYTPSPASSVSIAESADRRGDYALANPRPWLLDPLPLVLDASEWAGLEVGVVQRAELLAAILADLYGAQRLLATQQLPPSAVLDHDEFLRPLVGMTTLANQRPFLLAADLGRDGSGRWKVMADRAQAPSGAGYAMQNRRVVSRVMPELYHDAHLYRLTPFFHAMRMGLVDAAPRGVEDPRVVVLSPGPLSETAFDQAFVASLLGFPLVEGSDLAVRDGRVWLRTLGKMEQVDVILRRVDSTWSDPLELRAGSRLGVAGLVTAVRQGTVSVVNNLGSGVLENPALLPYLPELCQRLLGEPLRLPSVDTWWCGDEASLSHVLTHLGSLVIRPISRNAGRSVVGSALTALQREDLAAMISAAPHRFVGQELLRLSSAPSSERDRLVRRNVVLRSFAVQSGGSYSAMPGGLARVTDTIRRAGDVLVTPPDGGLAKDVWVVSRDAIAATSLTQPRPSDRTSAAAAVPVPAPFTAMVPRVLSDLFWFGRYAERAEDLLRLVLATRTVAIETDVDLGNGRALQVLLQAITHTSTAYPGFTGGDAVAMLPELRSMLLDRRRLGSVSQALASLSRAAQGVRDQLSADVFVVLADIDRALSGLSTAPYDQGLQLSVTSERVLSGLLALAGIVSENMVRDPGWYLLDTGRGLERALQLVSMLKVTLVEVRAPEIDAMVVEAVMTAAESIVTFRRRYHGRAGTDAVIELLVVDSHNPRSVAYQLNRIRADLQALPNASATSRPLRLVDSISDTIRAADLAGLVQDDRSERQSLQVFLEGLQGQLQALSQAVDSQYLQLPPSPQPLWRSSSNKGGLS
ncbi:MAG TPA: circularly permuted type 2 ATP-grasp protein [Propionibacteriaceae bacterium]|nr:circularly permuted type 2 ATP-grasp protein [Propionibacteriaceae bacterium]